MSEPLTGGVGNDIGLVTMILAGGKGERLSPLTQDRSKPSVPFGGSFRIIDFTLMNCVLSGIRRVHVLTQYESRSLSSHIQERWSFLPRVLGESIETVPPKLRTPTGFYRGTADAIYRNLDILEAIRPDLVLVLSGDHVYRADYTRFIKRHIETGADVSVLCGETDAASAKAFGVTCTDEHGWIRRFVEKPKDPSPFARNGVCEINLGVYCFNTRFLVQRLVEDAKTRSSHDFGKNILPVSLECGKLFASRFADVCPDAMPYWRDVGSIDSYFKCHQDLLDDPPAFSLIDPRLPADSGLRAIAPARISTGDRVERGWSLVCGGTSVGNARVIRSVMSPGVTVEDGATVDHCILLGGVRVGEGARVRNAILDEGAVVPPGARIGYGNEARRFAVSPGGVTVVGRNFQFLAPEVDAAARGAGPLRARRRDGDVSGTEAAGEGSGAILSRARS